MTWHVNYANIYASHYLDGNSIINLQEDNTVLILLCSSAVIAHKEKNNLKLYRPFSRHKSTASFDITYMLISIKFLKCLHSVQLFDRF